MYMGNPQRLVSTDSFIIVLKMHGRHHRPGATTEMDSFDSGHGNDSPAHLHRLMDKIRRNYAGSPKKYHIIACIGFAWQGLGGGGWRGVCVTGVASVRSC